MQANSSRKTEITEEIVSDHDFGLVGVCDAEPSFCDFCGTHLRYAAEIAAEDNPDVKFKVGPDCLEHVMGTSWSHIVGRRIKDFKEKAKRKRRKEKFAEKYETEIKWLEKCLEITEDDFLSEMHEVLTTGKREFTRKMKQAVHDNMKTVDLQKLKEKEDWIESVIERLEDLLKIIEEADKNDGAWSFVNSVRSFAESNRRVTDNQLKAVNDIYNRYKKHLSESGSEEQGEEVEVLF
jgi:hypothetical protein